MRFDPTRWNSLNTTVAHFLLNAVLTAFTCGVILGMVLLCGLGFERELPRGWEAILNSWLTFLGLLWGAGVTQFGIKRKTHQPGGSADVPGAGGPPGRPTTATGVPADA